MAGFMLQVGATIVCPHAGQVSIVSANTRVLLGGQPAATSADTFMIAGCPFMVGQKSQPCTTVKWIVPAVRVKINGQPAVLQTSTGLCSSAEQIPQGPPNVVVAQLRVRRHMTEVRFPYGFDGRGRTAGRDSAAEHVRDLVEQLLFTAPGERVNQPNFGAGLLALVHEPSSDELAGATQMLVHGALQQWLGEIVEVGDVTVRSDESTLAVLVAYRLRATGESRTEVFSRPAP